MRFAVAACLLCLAATTAFAQPAASPSAAPSKDTCVNVQVGTAQSYDCLNQQFKRAAENAQRFSSDGNAPYSATTSPSNVTGQFNESATRNRLGSNFGRSVTPEQDVARPH
jgi:hypothetical protein